MNHFTKAIELLDEAADGIEGIEAFSTSKTRKHEVTRTLLKAAFHIEMARDQPTNGVVPVHATGTTASDLLA